MPTAPRQAARVARAAMVGMAARVVITMVQDRLDQHRAVVVAGLAATMIRLAVVRRGK